MEQADLITKVYDLKKSNSVSSIISNYLLSLNADEVRNLRIIDIENNCHVSPPSVMRFCKECGYHSFSEFKYAFTDQLYREREVIQSKAELYEQPQYYLTIVEDTISKTATVLTEEKLNKAMNYWNEAKEIVIFAGGSSFFVAEDLERKLIKVGKYTFAYNDDYWMRFSVINAKEDTLFIGITYSGNTKSVIHNLDDAKEKGFKTILLTSYRNNQMEGIYDLLLYSNSSETRNRLVNTSSRIGLLFLIDVIYYAFIAKFYPEYFEKYSELRV